MATATSWITRRAHRLGFEGCIRDTNINVWGIVWRRQLSYDDAMILDSIQGLRPEDLEAAWEYGAAHPEEIDQAIERNAEG